MKEDAKRALRKGEFVSRYAGPVLRAPTKAQKDGRYVIELVREEELYIDGEDADHVEGVAQLCNTSVPTAAPPDNVPNCRFVSDDFDIILETNRVVWPGEELLVDYHWHFKNLWSICGCSDCIEASKD